MSVLALTEADNGKLVQATRGATVMVTLAENPTTGYRWAIETVNANILQLQNSTYSVNPGGGIGGGGVRTMTFQAITLGSTDLTLKLLREWEGDASITKRFRTVVNVQ